MKRQRLTPDQETGIKNYLQENQKNFLENRVKKEEIARLCKENFNLKNVPSVGVLNRLGWTKNGMNKLNNNFLKKPIIDWTEVDQDLIRLIITTVKVYQEIKK